MIKIKHLTAAFIASVAAIGLASTSVFAADADVFSSMTVTPMKSKIVLSPGETYSSTIKVTNSAAKGAPAMDFTVETDSFFVDEDYNVSIGASSEYDAMKNWITIEKSSGTVPVGSYVEVPYTITVPKDAPAGGQYASISISSVPKQNQEQGSLGIQEVLRISSTIYASISGESTFAGTITKNSVPSLVFTTPLTASTTVENTGNVHGDVTSYLQVFPLFSDEEVYTNEETPTTSTVFPGTSRYITNSWDTAPAIGIFRVIQTVEAFGGSSINEKIVLICPLWFIVVIGALLATCIFWLVSRAIRRKKD